MDGGAWWATIHGVAKSRTQLSDLISHKYMYISSLLSLSPLFPTHPCRSSQSAWLGSLCYVATSH